jgi:Na+/H+ antiporter NhaC
MEKVMNYLEGFFGGLVGIMMAILPVTILWTVLTGASVFGMNVITNLTDLVNGFASGGFTGLIVLLVVMSFFIKK